MTPAPNSAGETETPDQLEESPDTAGTEPDPDQAAELDTSDGADEWTEPGQ